MGLWTIKEYVRRRQTTIAKYAAVRTIYKLFTGTERMEGPSRFLMWWYQDHGPNNTEREVE